MRSRRLCELVRHCFVIVNDAIAVLLLSCSISAQSTDMHQLLTRAQAGYVKDEMKLARAYWLGLGVPRDALSQRDGYSKRRTK